MNRHIFVARDPRSYPRWQEAFPDAALLTDADPLPAPASRDTVWLSTTVPDWRARLARIAAGSDAPAVVALSLQPGQNEALLALDAGARGYCHALSTPELLREVGTVVRLGGLWIGPDLMARVIGAVRQALPAGAPAGAIEGLSPREQEVARAVATGCSNKEIARLLGITERTVKAHLGVVFEKLGVRDRLQLALRVGA